MDKAKLILAQHETFETKRMLLRKITLEDAVAMFEFTSDPEVARYVTYEPHQNVEVTQEGILDYFIPNRLNCWGIVDKASNQVIGTIDLRVSADLASFGWALKRDHWGKGFMPEAAQLLRNFAFEELGVNVIRAEHVHENSKSGRVMEKIGMSRIGQDWRYIKKENRAVLLDIWALTRQDYTELSKKEK